MRGLYCTILACWVGIVGLSHQPAYALSPLFDHQTMMPTSEIRRGMKAVGKSVFHGVEITDFNLEILGILEKYDLGYDVILARVLDGPVVERESGIIAGMSGSPVYINGRLVGAIAYRWAFEKEPLAGITCIDAMLRAFEEEEGAQQVQVPARGAIVDGRYVTKMQVVTDQRPVKFAAADTLAMQPVGPIISCAGFSGNAMKHLRDFFGDYGLKTVAGPGAMRDPVDTEIVPGAPVGIHLVAGDFDISSAGTTTYRQGDRVLAFGHSMMKLGQTQMPITTAWVHDIMPGLDFSYRFSSSMKQVGTITYDTGWSVAAKIGDPPPMIPAVLKIHNEDTNSSRTYHLQIADNKVLTRLLVTFCAFSAIEAAYDAGAEGMADISFTVAGDKGAQISRRNISYYSGDPSFAVVSELMSAITFLQENRFEPQQITNFSLEATINKRDETAFIEQVWAEEPVARAGEPVILHVLLRPDSGELVDKTIKLPMPLDLPKGRLRIAVGGGNMSRGLRARLRLLLPEFTDLQSVIREFEAQERSNQLFVAAAVPTTGLRIGPVRMNNVPQSVRDILTSAPRTNVALGLSELSQAQDTPWVIYGTALLTLPTEDRTGARAEIAVPTKPSVKPPEVEETSISETTISYQRIPASLWWAASAFAPEAFPGHPLSSFPPPPWLTAGPAAQPDAEADKEVPEMPDETEEEEEEGDETEGEVVRKPTLWSQSSAEDFAKGIISGVAIRSDGSLFLAPRWEEVGRLGDELTQTMTCDSNNNLYLGTSGGGRVYKYTDGQLQTYYETNEFAVTALAADADGTLYAGTMPEGKLFVITSSGEGKLLCTLPADYIWDLQLAADGKLWAATGPEGIIYQVDKDGSFSVYADLPQSHILALVCRDGVLLAGTSQPGCVYQITRPGRVVSLLEIEKSDITALTFSQTGELYAAAAPKGYFYKIDQDSKAIKVYEDKNNAIHALLSVSSGIYAGSQPQGKIISILGDQEHAVVHLDKQAGQVLAMAAGTEGTIYAALANPSQLLSARLTGPAAGTFTSPVLDAQRPSQWGRIRWSAHAGEGGTITAHCRAGNSTDPDDGTWSVWSRPYRNTERIDVPVARYLQYRLKIERSEGTDVPRVHRVAIDYLPANQRPSLTIKEPEEGTALRKTVDVKWKAKDPDEDTVAATVYLRPAGQAEWQKIAGPLQETSYELDTTEHEAGPYELRIVVSDEPSNPQGPQTDEAILRGLIIDNQEPTLRVGEPSREEDDGAAVITGSAYDEDSAIAEVSWQATDDENWHAAGTADGMYDEKFERFTIRAANLPEDATSLLIRARDRAGNVTDETVELPWVVPADEEDEEIEEAENAEEANGEPPSAED